jgi:hypothetical protein
MTGLQPILIAAVVICVLVMVLAARYGVSRRAVIAEIERELEADQGERRNGEERAA